MVQIAPFEQQRELHLRHHHRPLVGMRISGITGSGIVAHPIRDVQLIPVLQD